MRTSKLQRNEEEATKGKGRPRSRPPKKKPVKQKPDTSRKSREVAESFKVVDPFTVIVRLVDEAVRTRISHRALLDVLEEGRFDFVSFIESFEKLAMRDYRPLHAQLMLNADDFNRLFSSWKAEDTERYGVKNVLERHSRRPKRSK